MVAHLIDSVDEWSTIINKEDSRGDGTEALLTQEDASSVGCEWAYAFDEDHSLVIMSSYRPDGEKMIGMFGMGDTEAVWREVARVPFNEPAPNWETLGS